MSLFGGGDSGNLVWLHPAFPMGTDQEESLVSSGAEAAADVCECRVWLLLAGAPAGTRPFKRSSAEYSSAVAFWGGRDHWAHSLRGLPRVIADFVRVLMRPLSKENVSL